MSANLTHSFSYSNNGKLLQTTLRSAHLNIISELVYNMLYIIWPSKVKYITAAMLSQPNYFDVFKEVLLMMSIEVV